MNYFQTVSKVLLGWIAFAAVQVVASMLVPVKAPMPPHIFEWLLFTDLLVVAVIGLVAFRSDWTGWKLAAPLALIPFAINLMNVIEGSVFLKSSGINWRNLALQSFLTYALLLPLWRYIFGTGEPLAVREFPIATKSALAIAWRFVACDVLYLALYFTAGSLIYPFVKSFYDTQSLPSAGIIFGLQLCLRGPVFVLLCLLVLRMVGLPRWKGALATGLVFTMISGVAPLLMPNPYFPDYVRWIHFGEVVSSNFVFGVMVGLIWNRSKPATLPSAMSQAA